jgi:hypothetical protein
MSEQDLTGGLTGLPSQQEAMSKSLIFSLAQGLLKKFRTDGHIATALLLEVARHELNESSLFRKLLAIHEEGLLTCWTWARCLLEKLDAISDVTGLLVLMEQLGQPKMSIWLLVEYLDRKIDSPKDREELKARLTEELNELRKRGKPATLITEEEYWEEWCKAHEEGWKEEHDSADWWKGGS